MSGKVGFKTWVEWLKAGWPCIPFVFFDAVRIASRMLTGQDWWSLTACLHLSRSGLFIHPVTLSHRV